MARHTTDALIETLTASDDYAPQLLPDFSLSIDRVFE